jgi:predicted nuclease of restriction endonuclease-like (RecB) superfamily
MTEISILEMPEPDGYAVWLAHDLRSAFPAMKGFSARNLKYMRAFAEAWPEIEFVQEALAQLPWYHQIALLDKLKTEQDRRWYAAQAEELICALGGKS